MASQESSVSGTGEGKEKIGGESTHSGSIFAVRILQDKDQLVRKLAFREDSNIQSVPRYFTVIRTYRSPSGFYIPQLSLLASPVSSSISC